MCCGATDSAPEQQGLRRVGHVGEVPVVVPPHGELELELVEAVGKGAGGAAEGHIERRGDAGVGQRAPGRPDRVRGGERAEGVGRSGGARSSHHVRFDATWRQRSQAHPV